MQRKNRLEKEVNF